MLYEALGVPNGCGTKSFEPDEGQENIIETSDSKGRIFMGNPCQQPTSCNVIPYKRFSSKEEIIP